MDEITGPCTNSSPSRNAKGDDKVLLFVYPSQSEIAHPLRIYIWVPVEDLADRHVFLEIQKLDRKKLFRFCGFGRV